MSCSLVDFERTSEQGRIIPERRSTLAPDPPQKDTHSLWHMSANQQPTISAAPRNSQAEITDALHPIKSPQIYAWVARL